jgi:hypothetical protein
LNIIFHSSSQVSILYLLSYLMFHIIILVPIFILYLFLSCNNIPQLELVLLLFYHVAKKTDHLVLAKFIMKKGETIYRLILMPAIICLLYLFEVKSQQQQ